MHPGSLVLFINSRSLDGHIKCLKLREVKIHYLLYHHYLSQVSMIIRTCLVGLFVWQLKWHKLHFVYWYATETLLTEIQLAPNVIQRWERMSTICLSVSTCYQSIFFENEGSCMIFHCAQLDWVGENCMVPWTAYFLWKLRMSPNLGLSI